MAKNCLGLVQGVSLVRASPEYLVNAGSVPPIRVRARHRRGWRLGVLGLIVIGDEGARHEASQRSTTLSREGDKSVPTLVEWLEALQDLADAIQG